MTTTDLKGMPPEDFNNAVQAEILRLKREGYSNAHICERSIEIEEGIVIDYLTSQGKDFQP